MSNIIVSYLNFNSDFFIGVCSDLPLVRLVQESLFSFGKEKRQDVLVNNTRDAHYFTLKTRNGPVMMTKVDQESAPPNQ